MEVFKLLDKSNCGKCNEQTCLAFASRVFLGERVLNECPALSREILERYQGRRKKNALFVRRSEKSLKKIADTYTGLFEDLIVLFNGKKSGKPL